MKIALLAQFPPHELPELGEAFRPAGHYATWLPQLSRAFAEGGGGLEIHWVALCPLLREPRTTRWNGQTFHLLPTANRLRASTFFIRDLRAIRRVIKAIRPDILHGWGTEDAYALAAVLAGRGLGGPRPRSLVSMQGILSDYVTIERAARRVRFQAWLERLTLPRADLVTTESAWGRGAIRRRVPGAARVPVELVEYGAQPRFFQTPWRPDPQKPAAIFIGTLSERKGIADAVEAFRSPPLAGAELWALGDGRSPWARALRAGAPANVRWLGQLPVGEVTDFLSRAWCLVLPTRADTSPNVVKEARVVGLPVVTTPHGGQTTYVRHGENGFLSEPGDIPALTQNLAALLTDFGKTKAFGAAHHAEDRRALDPAETARRFHALYRGLAPGASA